MTGGLWVGTLRTLGEVGIGRILGDWIWGNFLQTIRA